MLQDSLVIGSQVDETLWVQVPVDVRGKHDWGWTRSLGVVVNLPFCVWQESVDGCSLDFVGETLVSSWISVLEGNTGLVDSGQLP